MYIDFLRHAIAYELNRLLYHINIILFALGNQKTHVTHFTVVVWN